MINFRSILKAVIELDRVNRRLRPVPAVRSIDGRMSAFHDMVEQTEMAKPVAETWYGLEPCSVGMIRVREVHGRPLPFR